MKKNKKKPKNKVLWIQLLSRMKWTQNLQRAKTPTAYLPQNQRIRGPSGLCLHVELQRQRVLHRPVRQPHNIRFLTRTFIFSGPHSDFLRFWLVLRERKPEQVPEERKEIPLVLRAPLARNLSYLGHCRMRERERERTTAAGGELGLCSGSGLGSFSREKAGKTGKWMLPTEFRL